jgi:hypothetical protein
MSSATSSPILSKNVKGKIRIWLGRSINLSSISILDSSSVLIVGSPSGYKNLFSRELMCK